MKHFEVSIAEELVAALAGVVRDDFRAVSGDLTITDTYAAAYVLVAHLEDGDVELRRGVDVQLLGQTIPLNQGAAVVVREMDVVFDVFWLFLVVDLEPICVGGQCLISDAAGKCVVKAPEWCVFEPTPDFVVRVDLRDKIEVEVSAAFAVRTHYQEAGQQLTGLLGSDAVEAIQTAHAGATEVADEYGVEVPPLSSLLPAPKDYDRWIFLLDPEWIDVDVPDFADTTANLLEPAIERAVASALQGLPDWAAEQVRAHMGSPTDYVRAALDLPDDFGEWLSETLGASFGVFNVVLHLIGDHFGRLHPVYELRDPYDLAAERPGEPPVYVSPVDPEVEIQETELVIGTDLGAAE